MAAKASSLRRNLFVALLVLMTLLPLVVYFYVSERGRELAGERLVQHVERSVGRTLELKNDIESKLQESGPRSPAVAQELERLAAEDEAIAYIQLVDRQGQVLSSTPRAPEREWVGLWPTMPLGVPEGAAAEVVRRLKSTTPSTAPEYVVDLKLAEGERGHMLVGISTQALDEQLALFQRPARLSALQMAILCVAILAVFSAYIVYLSERTRALHAQLQEESRLAYVGTLAASIAHEVRNPLSSVKMNVQMMENRLDRLAEPEERDYFHGKVERIKGEVDRLEDSVSHFLAFARPAPLRPQAVRLSDVVDNVLELLQPQCQSRGIQLARKHARDLPAVVLDPQQFGQAVQNLVLNAAQALERGGTITVATQAGEGCVVLSVADDGPGIPEEAQRQIFDVFFTTREGGTGLGLNIVSRIVEEHRGKLSVESQPGQGATFRIELPVGDETPKPQEDA